MLIPRAQTWENDIPRLYGLRTARDIARYLDVSETGFWRVAKGAHPPGNRFIARAAQRFSLLTLDQLFEVYTPEEVA